jgi:hypothetical protein
MIPMSQTTVPSIPRDTRPFGEQLKDLIAELDGGNRPRTVIQAREDAGEITFHTIEVR